MQAITRLLRRYGVALLVITIALLCTWVLWPLSQRFPFALFIAAVMASAWQGGPRPALLATGLSTLLLLAIFFLIPSAGVAVLGQDYLVRLALFVFVGLLTSYLSRECWQAVQAIDHVDTTLSSIGDALIFTDDHGRVTSLNALAQSLTGWNSAAAVDQPLEQILRLRHIDTGQPLRIETAKVLDEAARVPLGGDALLVSSLGTETPIEGNAVPVRDAEDRVLGILVAFRDVSKHRQVASAARQREARFQALTASLPVAMLVLEPDGRCVYANRACQTLTGVSSDATLGEGWKRLIPPQERPQIVNAWTATARLKQSYMTQFGLASAQGESRSIRLRSSPMSTEKGELLGHVATLEDSSERQHAEQALRETRSLLRAVMEATSDAVFLKDGDGRCSLANSVGARLLGKLADAQADSTTDDPAQSTRVVWEADGTKRVYQYARTLLRDEQGADSGFVEIYRDITDLKNAEETLNKARTEFEQTLAKRIAAHERAESALGETRTALEERTAAHQQADQKLQQARTEFELKLQENESRKRQAESAWQRTQEDFERQLAEATAGHREGASALREAHAKLETELAQAVLRQQAAEQDLQQARNELARVTEERTAERQRAEEILQKVRSEYEERLEGKHSEHARVHSSLEEERARRQQVEEALKQTQQSAEERLMQEKAFWEGLVEGCEDGVFAFDRDCRFTAWNAAMERISGVVRSRVLGQTAFDVFPVLQQNGDGLHFLEALEGKRVTGRSSSFAGNGQAKVMEQAFLPLRGRSAEILGGMAFVREMPMPENEGPVRLNGIQPPHARVGHALDGTSDWLAFN